MPDAERILVVEDDADINEVMATCLRRRGYVCDQAFSGTEAKLLADARAFDAVVCDLMLPGASGEEVVALIRERDPFIPIVVVSARDGVSDKVELLKLGADDYIPKPFDLREFAARIEVQLRHAKLRREGSSGFGETSEVPRIVRSGSWELNEDARTLAVGGAPVELTRIEYEIVSLLAKHPNRVFTKRELFERAWGEPYSTGDNTVTAHVSNIRIKLRAVGGEECLKTVRGVGFRFVPQPFNQA